MDILSVLRRSSRRFFYRSIWNLPPFISITTTPDVSAGSRFSVKENGPMTPEYFALVSASRILSESGPPAALMAPATMNNVS